MRGRGTDRELVNLTEYLLLIGDLPDLSQLNHKKWEHYVVKRGKRLVPSSNTTWK
jgi:ubiquitin-like domain-containing CTD phosphatase 1